MTQPDLFTIARQPRFDGATYAPEQDRDRLKAQLARVKALMADGRWRSPKQMEAATGDDWASIGARLRDLRKARFGSHDVERRRVSRGLFEYRVVLVAVLAVLGCLVASSPVQATPIFSSLGPAYESDTLPVGDITFTSAEPFDVHVYHVDDARPGSLFEGQLFGLVTFALVDGVYVATVRGLDQGCGEYQIDAFRGAWLELAYVFVQFANACDPPVCLTCDPPPCVNCDQVPEPAVWALLMVAVLVWRRR